MFPKCQEGVTVAASVGVEDPDHLVVDPGREVEEVVMIVVAYLKVVVAVMGGETVLLVVVLIEVDHRDSGLDIEKEDLIEQITEEVDHL